MTNSNDRNYWTDERLDRLADTVEANNASVTQLTTIAQVQQQSLASMQQSLEILVQEIRGLRAENRKMLSHLFGQEE